MESAEVSVAKITPGPGRSAARRRQSLHEYIVDDLRLRLLEGRIAPGTKVPEAMLCDEMGISRTPLREAMKVLAAEGLIRLLPNRGAVATDVTPRQIQSLFQVLASLEYLVGTLVVDQITPEALSRLEELHEKMRRFHDRRRRADYFRLNLQIHVKLAEQTNNDVLLKTYFSLTQQAMRARYLANMSDGRWDDSMSEHDAFMSALRERNGKRLGQCLMEHAQCTGEAVVAALSALRS